MTKICRFSWLSRQRFFPALGGCIAGSIGVAILLITAGIAVAQTPAPEAQPASVPSGYTVH